MANNFWHYYLFFLIDLCYIVCHNRLCVGTDEGPIFIKKVWDCSYVVIGALGGVGTFNVTMVFEFLIFIGFKFHSFALDTYEVAFYLTAVLR